MFGGRYTTGDQLIDKIMYAVLTVIIVGAFIIFGSPVYNKFLSMIW